MAIYRGNGGASDITSGITLNEVTALTVRAEDASDAAAASAAAAAASEAGVEADATAAASSATDSATSASNSAASAAASSASAGSSASSASSAASSAASASSSASTASAGASTATSAASTATTKASEASVSANNAAASAATATSKAAEASSSAAAAAASEAGVAADAATATSAANSATASASTATTAATSATNSATTATTAATTATTQATNASNSATAAANSQTAAAASQSAAATSATNAATSATNAATSETNAATSASNASSSANSAAVSASNASTAADTALATLDSFDDRYLGAKASAPTVDNDGNALLTGALYWNSTSNGLFIWTGSAWNAAAFDVGTALFDADIGVTVQPYDATILNDADIGVNVQAYDADTAKYDDATANFTGNLQKSGANVLTTSTSFSGDVSGTYNSIVVADDSHNHIIGNVDGLQAALDSKAPLSSPTLTGTPVAPTAAVGTNTTQIATTAFVNSEIANDAPTKTGTGASGTWGISVTGNAGTSTILQTARTVLTNLGSTTAASFNGSANITPGVTGTLPVARGGTGSTTLTANNVLLGNGTSALQNVAPGVSGNVLTSNGTTWVSAAGSASAITFISSQTVTSSVAQVDFTSGFSSLYDDYLIILEGVIGSAKLAVRIQKSGSFQTTGYNLSCLTGQAGGAVYAGQTNQSRWTIIRPNGMSTANRNYGRVYLLNVNDTTGKTGCSAQVGAIQDANNAGAMSLFTGEQTTAAALTGVRFLDEDANNFTAGTFRLYGIQKS